MTANLEVRLPRFMDFHPELKLPAEAVDQITQETKDGKRDEFGVAQVELFHNSDGQVYCLLDAPDADAVRHHHEALGIECGDVHEVTGLL
ncbi:MAG TPA: nickel-binding protein [Acidimicrobiales bacterium]